MKGNLLRLFIIYVMSIFTLGASAIRGGETPDKNYLCFTANTAGSTVELVKKMTPADVTIEYSTDGTTTWIPVDFSAVTTTGTITLNDAGDKVYFRKTDEGVTTELSAPYSYYYFSMTGSIAASGNVMSLIDKSCTATTIPCSYCFRFLFKDCTALTSAPELPATTLAEHCYSGMFEGCSALKTAPELPATTLADYCYECIFRYCTALETIPKLPVTELAEGCYYGMFWDCEKLTDAPELPAKTLANSCYEYMFGECTSLEVAPELPAETLAERCYLHMFAGCKKLKFSPELSVTTLANFCYGSMFSGCTSLTTAPELPATKLTESCYDNMFSGCTSLTTAPELPATKLIKWCYYNMFSGCTSLTTAPEIPATKLIDECCDYMFSGCTSLSTISVALNRWNAKYSKEWVKEVSSTGTFSCPSKLDTTSPGPDNNPNGWTVKNTYDLTITDAGWASMCVNLPLEIPTGVEVYYASAVEGSTISLTQIEAGTTIAPRTAVLVKGAKGTVSFPIISAAGTAYTSNLFAGTSVDKAKTENVYVLSGVGSTGNPQFQSYTGTTLGAHKIWLPASAIGGSNAKELRFVFENEETGIHNYQLSTVNSQPSYNLNGVRVNDGYKGIVIVNGKKVIKK